MAIAHPRPHQELAGIGELGRVRWDRRRPVDADHVGTRNGFEGREGIVQWSLRTGRAREPFHVHREDVVARVHFEIDASASGIEDLGPHPVARGDEAEGDLDLRADRLPSWASGRRAESMQEIADIESGNRAVRHRVEERRLQRVIASFVSGGGEGHA